MKKQEQRKRRKEKRRTKKERRYIKKELKKRIKYLKKTILSCSSEELQEIFYELENNPELNKKEIKVLIAKRIDAPPEIIEKLKNDKEAEIRFWAHDTENWAHDTENIERKLSFK